MTHAPTRVQGNRVPECLDRCTGLPERYIVSIRLEKLRGGIRRYGGGCISLAPLIFDVDAAFHRLGSFLEL